MDPEVKKIEEEFIQFFMNSPLFFGRDSIHLMILGFFLTRRLLTQKQLKNLTYLSAGKISRELNLLVKMGYLSKKKIPKSSQLVYYVESSSLSLFPYISDFLNISKKWEPVFNDLKNKLEENKEELEKDIRFTNISKIVNRYSDLLPLLNNILSDLNEI